MKYCHLIVVVVLITSSVTYSEYCYLRHGKEGADDYLECEFFGRNLPIEGISLIHLKYDTKIPVIKKSLIQPFRNLTTLYITAANVEKIEPGSLDGLQIQILDLFHNNLIDIENGTLNNLWSLTTLDISYNKFERLRSEIFKGLSALEWLSLNANAIRTIESGVFNDVRNLKALHMSFNNLSSLDPKCFSTLENLEYLDISYNALTELDGNVFSRLIVLQKLDLKHNFLNELADHLFDNNPVTYLDISHNRLVKFPITLLRNHTQLEFLDVSINSLQFLNATNLIINTPNLREIHIHGNQWECTTIKEALKVFLENNIYISSFDFMQANFIEEDMTCDSKNKTSM